MTREGHCLSVSRVAVVHRNVVISLTANRRQIGRVRCGVVYRPFFNQAPASRTPIYTLYSVCFNSRIPIIRRLGACSIFKPPCRAARPRASTSKLYVRRQPFRTRAHTDQDSGNKISRKAVLMGTQHIMLGGKTVIQPEAVIRGDLVREPSSSSTGGSSNTSIAIGRYAFLSRGAVLRPPGRVNKGKFQYLPLRMGEHVFVGKNTVVSAAQIGSHVNIGDNCTIGELAIIKDYVKVLDDAVVPSHMVVPSFSIVAGQPARIVGELPEGGSQEEFELRDLFRTVGNNPAAPA